MRECVLKKACVCSRQCEERSSSSTKSRAARESGEKRRVIAAPGDAGPGRQVGVHHYHHLRFIIDHLFFFHRFRTDYHRDIISLTTINHRRPTTSRHKRRRAAPMSADASTRASEAKRRRQEAQKRKRRCALRAKREKAMRGYYLLYMRKRKTCTCHIETPMQNVAAQARPRAKRCRRRARGDACRACAMRKDITRSARACARLLLYYYYVFHHVRARTRYAIRVS